MSEKIHLLEEKIKNREPIIGASSTMTDSIITEALADDGYDFIWIDMEHSFLDKRDILLHIMATRGTNAAAFVRVAWNDPVLVKPILEMDPDGIIFPFIKTPDDAKKAVDACTYPPKGIRGFGPMRSNKYGLIEGQKYIRESYSRFWTIMQIEHVEGVNNLESILRVEGVDAILVGPNDLSGSIGFLNQTKHPDVIKLMDQIGQVASKSGKPFGAVVGNDCEVAREWLKRGAHMIRVAPDMGLLQKSAREVFSNMYKVFTEERKNG